MKLWRRWPFVLLYLLGCALEFAGEELKTWSKGRVLGDEPKENA